MTAAKKTVGFIGWRGMVGRVLRKRMLEENDFDLFDSIFFTTSDVGGQAEIWPGKKERLHDAYDINSLKKCDILLTCQGGDYTDKIYFSLRENGWDGYWIDASSALRMHKDAYLCLDPVNLDLLKKALAKGEKLFVGANCTVSLMLMALYGLIKHDEIEWVSTMTYQAASGAGARHMKELVSQMGFLAGSVSEELKSLDTDLLLVDEKLRDSIKSNNFPKDCFGQALAGNLLPWIDVDCGNGQSREEKKADQETKKILGLKGNSSNVKVDGLCVRIGAMRSHSQALTIKLRRPLGLDKVNMMLSDSHRWIDVVSNDRENSLKRLTPAAISATHSVAIGRLRQLSFGPEYFSAFTVGDQLLWGAAEPLRRMLRLIITDSPD